MITDKFLEFDPSGTAITVTADSTNVLDLLQGRDVGVVGGDETAVKLLVMAQANFTAGGAATLQIQVLGAPDNGAGAPGAFSVFGQTDVFALATLVAGAKLLDWDMPRKPPTMAVNSNPRFIKLHYIVATGPMTAGTVQAEMLLGEEARVDYPSGFSVTN